MKKSRSKTYEQEDMATVGGYPMVGVKGQFSEAMAKFFGVRSSLSQQDGVTPTASYYPYYNQSNQLVGYKKRDWTVAKDDDWHFTTVGKVSASCKMFGQHKFRDGSKKIIVVEGEGDVMWTWYTLAKFMKNSNITQSYAVVGLPAGAVNAAKAASANEKFLLSGAELILGLDNDEREPLENKNVKRGKEATQDMFSVLLSDKVFKIVWPEAGQDAKDYATLCLKENTMSALKEFYDKVMYGAEKYLGSDIVKPSAFTMEEIFTPKPMGIQIKAFPELMEQTRGIRKNELTIITGGSGAGKSTITAEVMYELAEANQKVGIVFLEEEARETLQRMAARFLKIAYNKFKFDPRTAVSPDRLKQAYDWLVDEDADRFTLLNHFGSLQTKDLMDKFKQMVFIDKVDYIILDHISMVVSGNATNDERKDIDVLLTNLAAFVVPNDVGIIAINHLNRTGTADKTFRKTEEAYWQQVRKEDLRGSAALEQLCWNIWGIEHEVLPDRSRGRVRVVNLKNRPCGVLGEADILKMDEQTGLLLPAPDEQI